MITVIADDLTGAAEIAGICLRHGIDVGFGIDTIPENQGQVNVIATDSRSCSESEAYEIHKNIAKQLLKSESSQIIFKKCDSVLRGHILAEVSAMLEVLNKNIAVLQPANPENNRYVRNGIYYVNGNKIELSGFATDPDFPAKYSTVKDILNSRNHQELKKLDHVFTGEITRINKQGLYIPDCHSVDDFSSTLELYNGSNLIGGSAPFFEAFLLKQPVFSRMKVTSRYQFSSQYLLLSGSSHNESIKFAKALRLKNCPLVVFPKELLKPEVSNADLALFKTEITNQFAKHQKVTLRVSVELIHFKNSSKILKDRLCLIVKQFLSDQKINDIFIEGGATAYDVLKKLNWNSFTPIAELALGVVRMRNDLHPEKYITIKPGSYKWPYGLFN
ncbi:hypothetical protein PK35_00425 [Tamlana nanhaiensis]|uniref:Uncharacterized protein n=1 Tax=Neotamlana nanhaiensis TaxID=1382798 RepID=A0A0D7W5M4_9FLAO|nr:four-carbon acid sugar kinase family protein [Tamlana nanhaiensis]KJD34324.1 hypothetical protein PK35_00425 [Tamlana nanhaiensis]